jgi:hypothetical protein
LSRHFVAIRAFLSRSSICPPWDVKTSQFFASRSWRVRSLWGLANLVQSARVAQLASTGESWRTLTGPCRSRICKVTSCAASLPRRVIIHGAVWCVPCNTLIVVVETVETTEVPVPAPDVQYDCNINIREFSSFSSILPYRASIIYKVLINKELL